MRKGEGWNVMQSEGSDQSRVKSMNQTASPVF